MTLTFSLSVIGLALLVAPAWAANSSAEVDFLTRASNSDLYAIEESRLALDRSGDAKVKAFARRMVDEHGTAEAELQAAAEGSGAAVPMTLDEEHQARLTALRARSGADFDQPMSRIRAKTTPTRLPSMATTCCGASTRSFMSWRSR